MKQPELTSDRLLLRPLNAGDVAQLVALAGDRLIADTTATVPHPYHEQDARSFLDAAEQGYALNRFHAFAVTASEVLLGVVSVAFVPEQSGTADLGYWVGVPYWGNGYATEAARLVVEYAFSHMQVEDLKAKVLCRNPASAKVLAKAGMQCIGIHTKAIRKWGVLEDEEVWCISKAAHMHSRGAQDSEHT